MKLRCRITFKNRTLPWKTPKPNFVFIDWDGFLIYFGNLSFAQTFRKPGHHVVTSVCSHASQEYLRIFVDREPIRAREKHYSLVWYMQGSYVFRNPWFSRAVLPFFPGLFQGSWKSRMKTTFTTYCNHYKATMCSKCSDSILSSGF